MRMGFLGLRVGSPNRRRWSELALTGMRIGFSGASGLAHGTGEADLSRRLTGCASGGPGGRPPGLALRAWAKLLRSEQGGPPRPPGGHRACQAASAYLHRIGAVGGLGEGLLGRVLGDRWGSAAEGRADRLVGAPVADPARPGAPVAVDPGPLDGLPERQHFALGGEQVGLVRLV